MGDTLRLIPEPRLLFVDKYEGPNVAIEKKASLVDMLHSFESMLCEMVIIYKSIVDYKDCLPVDFCSREGYILIIEKDLIRIYSDTEQAKYYAKQTLFQIILTVEMGQLPLVKIIDWPELKVRGAHICYALFTDSMPYLAPDYEGLIKRVKELAHFKMNCILLELEAMFPYQRHSKLPTGISFDKSQLQHLAQVCKENHVQVIPLIQSIGHNYFVLKHPEYAELREISVTRQQFCTTNPKVKDLFFDIVEEVTEVFTDIEYLHIGADESWNLGKCDKCKVIFEEKGIGKAYSDYINHLTLHLKEKGIKAILYSDMLEIFHEIVDFIDPEIVVMYWNYDIPNWPRPYMLKEIAKRFDVISASGARFGTLNHTMYNYDAAMTSTSMLITESIRNQTEGFIITDWMKSVPYELTIPTLVYAGCLCWNDYGSLSHFEQTFGSIYFGINKRYYAEAMSLLAPTFPYCEDAPTHAPDTMDRYDLSGFTLREKVRKYTAKGDSDLIFRGFEELFSGQTKEFNIMLNYYKNLDLMKNSFYRGEEALKLLEQESPSRNIHEYDLLLLSAKTQIHKAKMGLVFEKCENTIKYPSAELLENKEKLLAELDVIEQEWKDYRKLTKKQLTAGTFSSVVSNVLDIKFEPEVIKVINSYKEALQR